MSVIELPLGLPGRVFRSPMPFGPYDFHGELYDQFRAERIAVIVLLASDEECLHKSGRNLQALYRQEGFEVLYLPIPDFGVPTPEDLEQACHGIPHAGIRSRENVAVAIIVEIHKLWSRAGASPNAGHRGDLAFRLQPFARGELDVA